MTDATPPTPPPAESTLPTPAPAPRKKRRWVLKTLAVLAGLVVLCVILLPTIAGLSPVRSLVVGRAQAFVPHGKLEVGDYSLGWFSPIKASGVRLLDDDGKVVVQADAFQTDMTLLQAIRRKFDLSGTVLDAAAHLVVYPDHHTNLQHVLGLDDAGVKAAKPHAGREGRTTPSKLPDVRGDFTLKLQGDATLLDAAGKPAAVVYLQPGSGGTVHVADINAPVNADLKLICATGQGAKPGTIGFKATVDAIGNNVVKDVSQIAATLDLPVTDVDLGGLTPLLTLAGARDVVLSGLANGDIAGELKPGETGGIKGAMTVKDFVATAPQLKEPYAATVARLPVELTRVLVDGVSRLQLHAGVTLPETSVAVTGDVSEAALGRLAAKQMAGDTGAVGISITADLKKLAAVLPKTLRVPADLSVRQGALACDITATLRPADVQTHVKTDITADGTRAGKPVRIEPITLTSDATLTDLTKLTDTAGVLGQLHDIGLSFTSGFAEVRADGPSMATVQGGGRADLAKAQAQIEQFVDLGGRKFAGEADFKLASRTAAGDATARHADLSADVTRLHVELPPQPPIDLASAKVSATADLQTDAQGTALKQVRTATASLTAGNGGQPLVDTAATVDGVDLAATIVRHVGVTKCVVPSLPALQAFLVPFVPSLGQQTDLADGGLDLTAELTDVNWTAKTLGLKKADGLLSKLSVRHAGRQVLDDTVKFRASANVAADRVTAELAAGGALFDLAAKNVNCRRPAAGVPAFKLLDTADLNFNVSDLAKGEALVLAFAPGMKLPLNASGAMTLACNVKGGTSTLNVTADRLAVSNAKGRAFAFDKPVSLRLTAEVAGEDAVDAVRVSTLDGDFGVARVRLDGPFEAKGLATTQPSAAGKVKLSGTIERIAPLLAVVQDTDTPLPYRGDFDFTEAVGPKKGRIAMAGGGTVDHFAMLDDGGKAQFSEDRVTLSNDLAVDLATKSAAITDLSLAMATSKAAALRVNGGVEDWAAARKLHGVVVHVDADGPKAWPLVFPLLPPNQQAQLKDTVLTGPVTFDLTADGSYPARPTWNESVRGVVAYGSVAVQGVKTMGLDVSDFVLPISVRDNGLLVVGDLRKKKADRFAKPFAVNGGTGDFSGVSLRLGDPALRLSTGRKQKLLQNVQINPVLASQVGSLASVIFNDAQDASGQLDLTVQECNNVALKELMDKKATASFLYSVHQLKLNGQVPAALSQALQWGDEGLTGDITNATLALKDGIANQDMTLTLEHENTKAKTDDDPKTKTESLKFKGGIDLAGNTFKKYNLTLSPGLLLKDVRKKFPDGATIELKGKVSNLRGIMAQAVAQLAVQGYGQDALDKVLGGDKDKNGDNAVDKLLDKLGGKKKSK